MAASVSHEINNPLEAVTNLLYLVRSTTDLASIHSYIDDAQDELNRVAYIARQSLGFYRESNSPTLTSGRRLLESAIDLLKAKITTKHARLETRWGDDVPLSVVPGELWQVFANLLANSLDAISFHGLVKIRTSAVLENGTGASGIRVTIADSGHGIPHRHRNQLFEPFFTTKGTVGTGLGLWVSKQILDKHHGTIQVRSIAEGRQTGTVFRITLSGEIAPTTHPRG